MPRQTWRLTPTLYSKVCLRDGASNEKLFLVLCNIRSSSEKEVLSSEVKVMNWS